MINPVKSFLTHGPSLLASYHSQAANKIVALNMSLFYCVVQSSFHDPQRFHLLTL